MKKEKGRAARWRRRVKNKVYDGIARVLPRSLIHECGWRVAAEVSLFSLERMKEITLWQAMSAWHRGGAIVNKQEDKPQPGT